MGTMIIYRGEYKVFECVAEETDPETGVVSKLNLTGASIYLAVRNNPPKTSEDDDSDALIAKDTTDGITITDGVGGKFEIECVTADTKDLPVESFSYGIKAVLSGYTDPVVLDVGEFIILESYVRAV